MLNLITDVPHVRVGHADDPRAATGVTAVVFDTPNVASGIVRGGAPGSRDTALLEPEMTVQGVDAITLSGGSVFGLDAGGGAAACLQHLGHGLSIGGVRLPIVVGAITFDLLNGGDKSWGRRPPYWDLGWSAVEAAATGQFKLGTVGGGYGATTANLKGGIGSASTRTASGFWIGALVVVNAIGVVTVGDHANFWAAPYEVAREFGGLGALKKTTAQDLKLRVKGGQPPSTTIGLVVTDARLTKAEAKRLAQMADDGLARAVRPAHAPMDGDTVFAVSTLEHSLEHPAHLTELGMCAADVMARAIARAVFEATALPYPTSVPAWRDQFSHLIGVQK